MGASSSKIEEDKALNLCRERKKFVRQALDGRCSLAAAHVIYIESLRKTGTALRNFVEPDATAEPSLYTSTSAMAESLAIPERALSQVSHGWPSTSQRIDTTETVVPSPSPIKSMKFQASHMKFRGSFSKKVEEKPSIPITGTVTSSSTPRNDPHPSIGRIETPAVDDSAPPGTPPWDYFGLFHPIDHQFSYEDGKGMHDFENGEDIRQLREEEGIPDLEDDEEKVSSHGKDVSDLSDDEFDEPSSDTLVRSFQNRNRVRDQGTPNTSPTMTVLSKRSIPTGSESVNQENHMSDSSDQEKHMSPNLSPLKAMPDSSPLKQAPDLSPLRATSSAVLLPSENQKSQENNSHDENKVDPKDFFSSMEDIESLFVEASESGKEVPRMLEANKLHFRPIFPGKESGPKASMLLKACFSCGEDPVEVPEEPAQNSVKYLTWHRTESSRSSSSRNPLGVNSRDDLEDRTSNLFDNFCMNSGSHASTLDRLYAWERKLYDEVKASEMVRRQYDLKCKVLRHLESKGESTHKIDKIRAAVKDLYSRIIIAIHRIDSISKRIEELRDKELQPQLEELIGGLRRMWNVMSRCHKLQFQIISVALMNGRSRITIQSEVRRQIAAYLENELHTFSSTFTKWIGAQKFYVESIHGWLSKCVIDDQKSSKRKRRNWGPAARLVGPPIYTTCRVWLEKLDALPAKDVTNSIKALAADTARFLPSQENKDGRMRMQNDGDSAANLLRDEAPEDFAFGFDRFQSNLIEFLGQLSNFAGSSVKMYEDLDKEIGDAKRIYEEWKKSQSFKST